MKGRWISFMKEISTNLKSNVSYISNVLCMQIFWVLLKGETVKLSETSSVNSYSNNCSDFCRILESLTHFSQMFHFYTLWKCQKTKGFFTSSEGIEIKNWAKNGLIIKENNEIKWFEHHYHCKTLIIFQELTGQYFFE